MNKKNDDVKFAYAFVVNTLHTKLHGALNKLMKIETNEKGEKLTRELTRISTAKSWYALNDGGVGSLVKYKCFAN